VLGVILFVGGQGLLALVGQYLFSGITGLLNCTIPLLVAFLALLIFRKYLTNLMMMGLAARFGGPVAPFSETVRLAILASQS
jgi:hypothetical protein